MRDEFVLVKSADELAPERKLAKGWNVAPEAWWCTHAAHAPYYKQIAKYAEPARYTGACEAHAAEMGVFEPMVTVEYTGGGTTSTGVFEGPSVVNAMRPIQEQCDAIERRLLGLPEKPVTKGQTVTVIDETTTFTEADWHRMTRIMQCKTCTHVHDIGKPCNGRSPFGEYSCPCGHERAEAKREVKVVGTYGTRGIDEARVRDVRVYNDKQLGHTATLLANLERERVPGRRPIRTVRWYEGNGDE